jgi:ATP-dependent exoDNAse (exonuclease V) alpha subunit
LIRQANILVIDEISMLPLFILDIIDMKLREIRENALPFGGIRLVFLGDLAQLEPVIEKDDKDDLREIYPDIDEDYGFYNSNVLRKDNYFFNNFDMYTLTHNFRQANDKEYQIILNAIRGGCKSDEALDKINGRFSKDILYDAQYQYLTISNESAAYINSKFNAMNINKGYVSNPEYEYKNGYEEFTWYELKKIPISREITMKAGMKIMFVINDKERNGLRWANGSIGVIKDIVSYDGCYVDSVLVSVNDREYEIFREKHTISRKYAGQWTVIGDVINFPFVPANAITIDKSQGLTLDKTAVVLEKDMRPNQLYVALSRAKNLEDIVIFGRKVEKRDIKKSTMFGAFMEEIAEHAVLVEYTENKIHVVNTININCENIDTLVINTVAKSA